MEKPQPTEQQVVKEGEKMKELEEEDMLGRIMEEQAMSTLAANEGRH